MEGAQESSRKRGRRRRKRRVCGYRTLKRAPRMALDPPAAFAMYWLKRAERQVSSRLARELKELNLIPSEWQALRRMYESARTSPLALARFLNMTKGGASKLISRLVKKKLVRKKVSQFDRRSRVVGLTLQGERLIPCLAGLEWTTDYEFFRRLRGKHRRKLVEALKDLTVGPRRLPTMEIPQPTEPLPPPAPTHETVRAKDADPRPGLLDWSARSC